MKLLKRFRKQGSAEDIEAQAARELDEAVASAKPADMASPVPAPPPTFEEEGTGAVGGETGNGDAPKPVTDLDGRRRSGARKTRTGSGGAATTRTKAADAEVTPRTRTARTAKTAAPDTKPTKAPVRKAAKKPADAATASRAKKPNGTQATPAPAKKSPGRAAANQPAAKKR